MRTRAHTAWACVHAVSCPGDNLALACLRAFPLRWMVHCSLHLPCFPCPVAPWIRSAFSLCLHLSCSCHLLLAQLLQTFSHTSSKHQNIPKPKYPCHWSPGQQLRTSDGSVFWSVASDLGFFILSSSLSTPFLNLLPALPPLGSQLLFGFLGSERTLAHRTDLQVLSNRRSSDDSDVPFYRMRTSQLPGLWVSFLFLSAAPFKHMLWVSLFFQWSLNRAHYTDQRGVRQVVVYNVTIWPQWSHLTARTPNQCFASWHPYTVPWCPLSWGRSARVFGSSNWALVVHEGKAACPAFVKDAYRVCILLFEFFRSFQSKNLISWLLLFIGNELGCSPTVSLLAFCSAAFSRPFSTRCLTCGSS